MSLDPGEAAAKGLRIIRGHRDGYARKVRLWRRLWLWGTFVLALSIAAIGITVFLRPRLWIGIPFYLIAGGLAFEGRRHAGLMLSDNVFYLAQFEEMLRCAKSIEESFGRGSYRLGTGAGDMPTITCLVCGRTSYHPMDVQNRYCGYCHEFHEMPSLKFVAKLREKFRAE